MDDAVNIFGFMRQYVLPGNQETRKFDCLPKLPDDLEQSSKSETTKRSTSRYNLRPDIKHKLEYCVDNQESETDAATWTKRKKVATAKKQNLANASQKVGKGIDYNNPKKNTGKELMLDSRPVDQQHSHDMTNFDVPLQQLNETLGQLSEGSTEILSFETLKEELSRKNGLGSHPEDDAPTESLVAEPCDVKFKVFHSDANWCFSDIVEDCAMQNIDIQNDERLDPAKSEEQANGSLLCNADGHGAVKTEMPSVAEDLASGDLLAEECGKMQECIGSVPASGACNGAACAAAHEELKTAREQLAKLQEELSVRNEQLRGFAQKFTKLASGFLDLSAEFKEYAEQNGGVNKCQTA